MNSMFFHLFRETIMRKFFSNHLTILGCWLGSSAILVVLMTLSGIHS